jgi:hypothetical protein
MHNGVFTMSTSTLSASALLAFTVFMIGAIVTL